MIEDKKEAVLQAAMLVFSTEGFYKAKITKIAEIAGVGAGTVYLYFKNKESILEEIFIKSWTTLEKMLNDLNNDESLTPKQKIHIFLNSILSYIENKQEVTKLILHEYRFWSSGISPKVQCIVNNTKSLFQQIIQDGIDQDNFRKNLDSYISTEYIIGGIWHYIAYLSEKNHFHNIDNLVLQLEELIFSGLL